MTRTADHLHQLTCRAMGGHAHVMVRGGPDGLLEHATRRLEHLERMWSRFLPSSDVSRLNAQPGRPVTVAPETVRLVRTALVAWRLTVGLFDPTLLTAITRLGYDRTFSELHPAVPALGPAQRARSPGCAGITWDEPTCTVTLPAGTGLDPGGLGKGLAADLLCQELLAQGAAAACVNVGGDLRAAVVDPDAPGWTVGVDDPHRPGHHLAALSVRDAGVATSSHPLRRWAGAHHLLDPSTGLPTKTDLDSVTVAAPDAALADALTKAAYVQGVSSVLPLLEACGAQALFVRPNGDVQRTPGWPRHSTPASSTGA